MINLKSRLKSDFKKIAEYENEILTEFPDLESEIEEEETGEILEDESSENYNLDDAMNFNDSKNKVLEHNVTITYLGKVFKLKVQDGKTIDLPSGIIYKKFLPNNENVMLSGFRDANDMEKTFSLEQPITKDVDLKGIYKVKSSAVLKHKLVGDEKGKELYKRLYDFAGNTADPENPTASDKVSLKISDLYTSGSRLYEDLHIYVRDYRTEYVNVNSLLKAWYFENVGSAKDSVRLEFEKLQEYENYVKQQLNKADIDYSKGIDFTQFREALGPDAGQIEADLENHFELMTFKEKITALGIDYREAKNELDMKELKDNKTLDQVYPNRNKDLKDIMVYPSPSLKTKDISIKDILTKMKDENGGGFITEKQLKEYDDGNFDQYIMDEIIGGRRLPVKDYKELIDYIFGVNSEGSSSVSYNYSVSKKLDKLINNAVQIIDDLESKFNNIAKEDLKNKALQELANLKEKVESYNPDLNGSIKSFRTYINKNCPTIKEIFDGNPQTLRDIVNKIDEITKVAETKVFDLRKTSKNSSFKDLVASIDTKVGELYKEIDSLKKKKAGFIYSNKMSDKEKELELIELRILKAKQMKEIDRDNELRKILRELQ